MSKSIEILVLRRQLLQARAAHSRVQIRLALSTMHDPLRWARASVTEVATHPFRYTLIGLALYGAARGRLQRWLVPAVRTFLLTRLAGIAASLWKSAPQPQSPAE